MLNSETFLCNSFPPGFLPCILIYFVPAVDRSVRASTLYIADLSMANLKSFPQTVTKITAYLGLFHIELETT